MALETVVFQQEPFSHGGRENVDTFGGTGGSWNHGLGDLEGHDRHHQKYSCHQTPNATSMFGFNLNNNWDNYSNSPSSMRLNVSEWDTNSSFQENFSAGRGFSPVEAPASYTGRRKRRRSGSIKNEEEVEHQRMTHITVERNRRKQMNDYLAVLRSLMPPSYVQRGDQASIIGGAINYVKELEQLLHSLEAHKKMKKQEDANVSSHLFSEFFSFPQYSAYNNNNNSSMAGDKRSSNADVEVTMVESHANIKILLRRRPKQLFKMVAAFYSLCLAILHLNITAVDHMVLYSFSVKIEDECQLTSVNEIAAAVYEMVGRVQEEAS